MVKFIYLFVCLFVYFISVDEPYARRGWQGCCSWHGGVSYQCVNGRMLCNDGTLSPTCLCDNSAQPFPLVLKGGSFTTTYGDRWTVVDRSNFSFKENKDIRKLSVQLISGKFNFLIRDDVENDECLYVMINGKKFFIDEFTIVANNFLGKKEVSLAYSIDGSKYKRCIVRRKEDFKIEFTPEDIEKFFQGCLDGKSMRFVIETEYGQQYLDISLIGFTSAYNEACSLLEKTTH